MKKQKTKKLALNKETLRDLTSKEMRKVQGGGMTGADDQANNCPGGLNGGHHVQM